MVRYEAVDGTSVLRVKDSGENNHGGGSITSTQQRYHNDGFKYLRDYGAMKVFASANCPICLDDHDVIVSLKCGHCLCREDYRQLGGYLASEKDALLAKENVTVVDDSSWNNDE
eukprot:scaffold55884_cov22-Cyclotella_meneghiniana.AAC.1